MKPARAIALGLTLMAVREVRAQLTSTSLTSAIQPNLYNSPPPVPATLPVAGLASASLSPWNQFAGFYVNGSAISAMMQLSGDGLSVAIGKTMALTPQSELWLASPGGTKNVPNGWYAVRITFGSTEPVSQTFTFSVPSANVNFGSCTVPASSSGYVCTSGPLAITNNAFLILVRGGGGTTRVRAQVSNILMAQIK